MPPPTVKGRILLVDDDPSVRASLAQVLREEHYRVFTAANGVEALSLVPGTPVDLVLLDLNMPEKNGWDTFERLTTDNPFLPIIVITARPNQLFTALAAGVDALLEKPLDMPELLTAIDDSLHEEQDTRLARRAGKKAEFRYAPAHV